VQNVDGNHRSLAECVEALKREVEALRKELTAQERAKETDGRDATKPERLPWKFRDS
jgi:hypothetical protein